MTAKGSETAEREFIDTNVLIYAHDATAGKKQAIAQDLIQRLWESGTGCLSVQVLQEFFVTITRKVGQPLSVDEAGGLIRDYSVWRVFSAKPEDVVGAIELQRKTGLSFWDAMILRAASELGCGVLWTEDMTTARSAGMFTFETRSSRIIRNQSLTTADTLTVRVSGCRMQYLEDFGLQR